MLKATGIAKDMDHLLDGKLSSKKLATIEALLLLVGVTPNVEMKEYDITKTVPNDLVESLCIAAHPLKR